MSETRICFLSETYHPLVGGTQTQMRLLAEKLVAGGFGCVAVTRRVETSLAGQESIEGTEVYRVGPVGKGQGKRWGMMFACMPRLIGLRRRYDVIYVAGFRALGVSAVLASKVLGKKCVLRAASNGEMSGEFFATGLKRIKLGPSSLPVRLFLAIRNAILRRADCFVAMSEDIARELADCGVPPERIRRIPNCVDMTLFAPADEVRKRDMRKKLGLPEDGLFAIYTGRLVSYKGLPQLVEVWKNIAAKHAAARLLLVGSEANDIYNCEAALRSFVEANSLQDSVLFTGEVKNVQEYLNAADIFVLPTENELFSNSLIEAMACGLAVVSTPVGGLKDIVENGRNGILVEPRSGHELSDALEKLAGDRRLISSLGSEAVKTVAERYSRDAVCGQYADLFRALASGSRAVS